MEWPLIKPGNQICRSETLTDGGSLRFRVQENGETIEAFLIRFGGKYHAYRNRCAHMALTLDLDDNDFFTLDLQALICKTHAAMYHPLSGVCFSGPCVGKYLEAITIAERDGIVYLVGRA